jgi:lipoprotein-anchoring transpeptidase ErfK/SrfK
MVATRRGQARQAVVAERDPGRQPEQSDGRRIHGTNRPSSIGGFVSYGCIRMYNQDILDLYGRVSYGTTVVVQ